MQTTETIRKYEVVVILDAKLTNEQKDAIIKEVTDSIQKHGAKVINKNVWLEKQRFTFPIRKQLEGTYYLIKMEGDGAANSQVSTDLRLNEKILRFAVIKMEE